MSNTPRMFVAELPHGRIVQMVHSFDEAMGLFVLWSTWGLEDAVWYTETPWRR